MVAPSPMMATWLIMEDKMKVGFTHQTLTFHPEDHTYEATNTRAMMLVENTSGIDLPIPNGDWLALITSPPIYNMYASVPFLYPVDDGPGAGIAPGSTEVGKPMQMHNDKPHTISTKRHSTPIVAFSDSVSILLSPSTSKVSAIAIWCTYLYQKQHFLGKWVMKKISSRECSYE